MAFVWSHDLSKSTTEELYTVYLAIARADHEARSLALYGHQPPPQGHFVHRPLPRSEFDQRLRSAGTIPRGDALLRARLARQAAVYAIDVAAILDRRDRLAA